jgi:hypothetical protein
MPALIAPEPPNSRLVSMLMFGPDGMRGITKLYQGHQVISPYRRQAGRVFPHSPSGLVDALRVAPQLIFVPDGTPR